MPPDGDRRLSEVARGRAVLVHAPGFFVTTEAQTVQTSLAALVDHTCFPPLLGSQ